MPYTDRITSTVKYGIRMAQSNHASWWIPANGVSANMREKVSAPEQAANNASNKCIGIRRNAPPRTNQCGGEIGPAAYIMVSNLILPGGKAGGRSRPDRYAVVELDAEIAQITLDAGRVAEDEAGQRAKDHVMDVAIFGDPGVGAAARRGKNFEGPRAAERQAAIGYPRHQPFRRFGFHQLKSNFLPVGILFPPMLAPVLFGQNAKALDAGPPIGRPHQYREKRVGRNVVPGF